MTHARLALILMLALVAPGCSNTAAPTNSTDLTGTTADIIESFAGTVAVNGAVSHPFIVAAASTITATLTSVGSGTDVAVGMALGTWTSTTETCQVIIANDNAIQGRVIVGTAQVSGTFCLRMFDAGKLAQATTYEVTLSHR